MVPAINALKQRLKEQKVNVLIEYPTLNPKKSVETVAIADCD